jgi:NTE family protein
MNLVGSHIHSCRFRIYFVGLLFFCFLASGCAHYPVNDPLTEYNPDSGYKGKNTGAKESSDELLFLLTFSGGGMRASALSYGVLEELAGTEILLDGKKSRLLDEVDIISSVSGGSFTSAYYGLFGDRIFDDYESRFLKKNIQRDIIMRVLSPLRFFKFLSPSYDRSDLAAEYYDRYIFDSGTFKDMQSQGGPLIVLNATDMTLGSWFAFTQNTFDMMCSDISNYPVSRAVAASSAVPLVFTPITLKNYAGSCNYQTPDWINEAIEEREVSSRRFQQAKNVVSYLDIEKKPYIHLLDGGISDNLALRVAIDRITQLGDMWNTLKFAGLEKTRKIVFIVVNAQIEPDFTLDQKKNPPAGGAMMRAMTGTPMSRYNFETVELLKESVKSWTDEIRSKRCNDDNYVENAGAESSCSDIEFYVVEVNFDALRDKADRDYFNKIPTSYTLPPETVGNLREVAGRLLNESPEYQRLLGDLE